MIKINISNPRRVTIGSRMTVEKLLDKNEFEYLAGDIQNWLMREKGILIDIGVKR